jgi:hypothetical protein
MKFGDDHMLLKDPNIRIADTAASVDITGSKVGMFKVRRINTEIIGVRYQPAKAIAAGNLHAIHCDGEGRQVAAFQFQNLTVNPESDWNVISITKRMKQGWTMYGDHDNGIVLRKDGIELTFNIKVRMKV